MSFLSRLLLRSTNSFNTTTTTNIRFSSAVAATSQRTPSLITLVNDENDPKHITEKFKKACQTEWFRKNKPVYERTVRRQEIRMDRGDPGGAEQVPEHVKGRIRRENHQPLRPRRYVRERAEGVRRNASEKLQKISIVFQRFAERVCELQEV
ncbi:hypothetical protein F2Q69_00003347 [Brassica cretica]|uniref:Uncharacterized protein n=1 Tax=Brassica cretica TaxID=69181 RepID=A0A8S9NVL9_BRACR|nr:hypothetical protein F2Q69_00003347 [Brassica cretica]